MKQKWRQKWRHVLEEVKKMASKMTPIKNDEVKICRQAIENGVKNGVVCKKSRAERGQTWSQNGVLGAVP